MKSIALKMLMGDRAKFLGILMALTFASLLITQQMAIFLGLGLTSFLDVLDAERGLYGSELELAGPAGSSPPAHHTLERHGRHAGACRSRSHAGAWPGPGPRWSAALRRSEEG